MSDEENKTRATTGVKFSAFKRVGPQEGNPVEVVGLRDGENVRASLTTDLVETNPGITFRNSKGQFAAVDPGTLALTNQLKVNRYFYERLEELGVALPDAPAPAANYVPYVQVGDIVYVSGQISNDESGLITGKLGDNMTTESGAAAARRCAINLLAQVRAACGGDLDKLVRVVKLTGFVNSTSDFTEQPQVVNGASDFMVEALGDAGRHSRSAVSAAALPLGVAVEIEGIFQISS